MNKLIIASAAAVLMMGASVPVYAQATPADCQNLFQKADVNKDGSLQADEAKMFIDAMNQAQIKPQNASMVTQDEFMQACQKNAFASIDPAKVGAASGTAASTETTTTGQGTTTSDQSASGTVSTDQSQATTQTTEQAQTGTQTTEQPQTTDQTATTTTTETQQAQPQEQALAAPSGLLASNLIGSTVYSQDNQSIGDINDIILSQEGQPSQVIVGVGGFLGIGEKDVVLDMSKLQIAATDDGKVKIVTQTTQDDLRNMPAFMRPAAQSGQTGNTQQQQQPQGEQQQQQQ